MSIQNLQIIKQKQEQVSQLKKEISQEISSNAVDFKDYYYFQVDEKKTLDKLNVWLSIYIPNPQANDNSFFELSIVGDSDFKNNFLNDISINLQSGKSNDEKTVLLMYSKEIKEFTRRPEDLFPGMDLIDLNRELYDKKDCFKCSVYDISFMDFLVLASQEHIKPYLKKEGIYKGTELDKNNIDTTDFLNSYEKKIPFLLKSFLEKKYVYENNNDIVGNDTFHSTVSAIEQQEKKKYFKELDIKLKEKELSPKSLKI